MANTDKNGIIYLEIDEDITSAIDKLTKNTAENIQVVTAKRSSLFQSVINMKLLKKAATDNKKVLTLVTADRVATNLAGRIGVPVAERIGEPGRVPSVAGLSSNSNDEEIDGGVVGDNDAKKKAAAAAAAGAAVGAVAASQAAEAAPAESASEAAASSAPAAATAKSAPSAAPASAVSSKPSTPNSPKAPKGKRVPNIGIMQKRFLWIAGGIFAILLLLGANFYFTSAKVTLFAKGTQVNAGFKFTADPSIQTSNIDSATLAASQPTIKKTLKGNVAATGTKDNGTKAKGTMTVFNRTNNDQKLIAGTRFQAPDGKIFRSQSDITVPKAFLQNFSPVAGQTNVEVVADQNGDGYNLGPVKYSIPALGSDQIFGQGGQMSGGTTKTSKVITQGDVDKAKQAALDADKSDAQKSLEDKVDKDQVLLDASIQQKVDKVTANPEVGSEEPNGSVSVEVTYTALAVNKSDLSALTKSQVQDQIGADKEIYEDGSDNMQLTSAGAPTPEGAQSFNAKVAAFAGTKIDREQLAKDMKGKKVGDAIEIGNQAPDVERTEIVVKPGWSTSMPGIVKHIEIEVKASNQ
jgi:hypothetical protein